MSFSNIAKKLQTTFKTKIKDKTKRTCLEATSPLLSPTYYSANRHRISVIGVVVQQDVLFHRKKNKCFSYILVF